MQQRKNLRKKYRVKKKKTLLENNFLSALFFIVLFSVGGLYLFVFHSFFQVDALCGSSKEEVVDQETIKAAGEHLEGEFLFFNTRSIFLVSSKEIEKEILQRSPSLKEVQVKRVFPSDIEIAVKERSPVAVWCKRMNEEGCFLLDKEGVVFQEAETINNDLLRVIKEKDYSKGDRIVQERVLSNFFLIDESFKEMGIGIVGFYITSGSSIELLTKEGWSAYFSERRIKDGIKDLEVVMEELRKKERKKLDYVDLRFDGRVFYK